jgi:hypothetical protein
MTARVRVVCALAAIGARVAGAQARPTVPRDTGVATPSDSAARDSAVTRILEQDSSRAMHPSAFSLLGLDRMRLRTVGVAFGSAWPGQAVPTRVYALHADYGEVLPGLRVLFVSSYWTTRFKDAEVARLAAAVRNAVKDPSRDDTVRLGRINVADLSGGVEMRWQPVRARPDERLGVVRPWVAGGMAAHFVNVEGPPVSGTFVERALDAATIGLAAALGVDLRPLPNFLLSMQARYDFLSSVRYASARAGASFVFGPAGATR